METYRRTLYGAALQTAQLLGLDHVITDHTTLNEKLAINALETIGVNEVPRMKYISIGIGGHRANTGPDGIVMIDPIQHDATHASSYRMLPFVMRPLDSDLSSVEMARYALRRIETHGGIEYAVYYLRRLDMSGVTIQLKKKTVYQGTETVVDYIPTSSVLAPVPPVTTPGANVVDGDYVYATARVSINFDTFDATEILNSASILYGDENAAFISELAFVTGVDRTLQAVGAAAQTFNMNEVVGAQVFCHVSAMQPMVNQRNGFEATYDIGIAEPMMTLTGP